MSKRIFVGLFIIIFMISQVGLVFAKGVSGARSSGVRSYSSKSSGYSGSSSSKSTSSSAKSTTSSSAKSSTSSSTKSSNGYSGSSSSKDSSSADSTRSAPSSYASSSKTSTAKTSYMQDQYKNQTSSSNYKTYQQNLNTDQQKAYDASMNNSYRVNNKMNFDDAMNTRSQRINTFGLRQPRVNYNTFYFGGPLSYGSAFIGPWDMWFVMRASDLFWYHHWSEISLYRDHFAAEEFAAKERTIQQMQAQNVAVDPNYLDPDVDPDLQFSKEYQEKNVDNIYYSNNAPAKTSNSAVNIIVIVLIAAGVIMIIRTKSKPKPKGARHSNIY